MSIADCRFADLPIADCQLPICLFCRLPILPILPICRFADSAYCRLPIADSADSQNETSRKYRTVFYLDGFSTSDETKTRLFCGSLLSAAKRGFLFQQKKTPVELRLQRKCKNLNLFGRYFWREKPRIAKQSNFVKTDKNIHFFLVVMIPNSFNRSIFNINSVSSRSFSSSISSSSFDSTGSTNEGPCFSLSSWT